MEKITSWKKERYRRQKIQQERKARKRIADDLSKWCDELLKSYKVSPLKIFIGKEEK